MLPVLAPCQLPLPLWISEYWAPWCICKWALKTYSPGILIEAVFKGRTSSQLRLVPQNSVCVSVGFCISDDPFIDMKPKFITWFFFFFFFGSEGKESACNAGDPSLIPGLGRSPGEGNGNPLQYSYLENPMDRGAWQAQPMGSQIVRHHWASNTFLFFFKLFILLWGIARTVVLEKTLESPLDC